MARDTSTGTCKSLTQQNNGVEMIHNRSVYAAVVLFLAGAAGQIDAENQVRYVLFFNGHQRKIVELRGMSHGESK